MSGGEPLLDRVESIFCGSYSFNRGDCHFVNRTERREAGIHRAMASSLSFFFFFVVVDFIVGYLSYMFRESERLNSPQARKGDGCE